MNRIVDCFDQNQGITVKDIWENFYYGQNSSLKNKLEASFTNYWGKFLMLRNNYTLSNNDYLRIHFPNIPNQDFYGIDLHDRNFHMDFSEQFVDFQRVQVRLENGFKKMFWIKVEQIVLLPELSECNNHEDYSFLGCSKVMILK